MTPDAAVVLPSYIELKCVLLAMPEDRPLGTLWISASWPGGRPITQGVVYRRLAEGLFVSGRSSFMSPAATILFCSDRGCFLTAIQDEFLSVSLHRL